MIRQPEETAGLWQQSIPRQAYEVDAFVYIRIDVPLLHTGFSNEGDELKKARYPDGQPSNWTLMNCNDIIQDEFQGTNDKHIVI